MPSASRSGSRTDRRPRGQTRGGEGDGNEGDQREVGGGAPAVHRQRSDDERGRDVPDERERRPAQKHPEPRAPVVREPEAGYDDEHDRDGDERCDGLADGGVAELRRSIEAGEVGDSVGV